jgi:polar amino acid transport system substrate-binding protein
MMFMRFLISLLLIFMTSQEVMGDDKLLLNTGTLAPYSTKDRTGFLDLIVAEAFRRIGVEAEVVYSAASARALQLANDGLDDGVAARIKGIDRKYPNLIRIPEKVMDTELVAYSVGKAFRTEDWDSLDPYIVGYINGWRVFKRNLSGHAKVTTVKTAEQLFALLKMDRIDIALYDRWQGQWRARELGLNAVAHEPPLVTHEMFMYLHKKHRELVPKVALALAEMKKDGAYREILDRTLMSLVSQ